jgi:hypothetical protein
MLPVGRAELQSDTFACISGQSAPTALIEPSGAGCPAALTADNADRAAEPNRAEDHP